VLSWQISSAREQTYQFGFFDKRKKKKKKEKERIATTHGPSSSLFFGRLNHMQCNNSAA
jgi:hypothetical protein